MPDKRIQAGRLALLIVVLCVATPVAQVVEPHTVGLLIIAGVLTALAVVFVVAMPFVIQTASWALAKTLPTPAARRNQMWPKRAWHRVIALSLLAFGLGWLGAFPVDTLADDPHYEDGAMFTDIATGGYIVVATGFLTAAVSTLLTQMASVYENRGLDPSLLKMGAPRTFVARVAVWETLGPLVLATVLTAVLGFYFGVLMYMPEMSLAGHLASARGQMLVLVAGYAVVATAPAGADVLRCRLIRQLTRTVSAHVS